MPTKKSPQSLSKPRGKAKQAQRLGAIQENFDAAATLLDRFELDGVEVPHPSFGDANSLLAAIDFVADTVDPRDPDRVVQQFLADYAALADRGITRPRRGFR